MFSRHQIDGSPQSGLQPWLFQVEPYPEESFSHFLGRFRRANHLSSAHLSAMLKQRPYAVSYWETPSRRRQPSPSAIDALAQRVTGVDIECLCLMRSPPSTKLHLLTRLCAYCYGESPHHRLSWQEAERSHCEVHHRQLLEVCPECRSTFQLPSYWQSGECDCCHLPFQSMCAFQQPEKG